jgi:hypothetical protein
VHADAPAVLLYFPPAQSLHAEARDAWPASVVVT